MRVYVSLGAFQHVSIGIARVSMWLALYNVCGFTVELVGACQGVRGQTRTYL